MERSSFRKSTSRSPSKSVTSDRSSSIDRSKRSGSTRSRGHSQPRESPRKERSKAEGSPLRTRKHVHGERPDERREEKVKPAARDSSSAHYQEQNVRNESRQSESTVTDGQISIGQYNPRPGHRSDIGNRINGHRDRNEIATGDGRSSAVPSGHTHYVRDTRDGVSREVIVDGVHDALCRSPTKPSKEVIIPIKIEGSRAGIYDEGGRSRSRNTGHPPMSITDGRSSNNDGRSSNIGESGRTSANGRSSVAEGRQLMARTSTPMSTISSHEERPRYTLIDHSKSEVHEERIVFPVMSTEKIIPIQMEGTSSSRNSNFRTDSRSIGQISRSEERQFDRPRYEGSRTKFGARESDQENPFRPFSRSVSGTNPYSGSTTQFKSSLSAAGATGNPKATPYGSSRHALIR